MPQTAFVSGVAAMATGVPVLTTQPSGSAPWWIALLISGMGAAGTAFGSMLGYLSRRRRDKMDETAQQFARLNAEIRRLDDTCARQQEEIDGKRDRLSIERDLKHECNKKLQLLQTDNDILMEKLKNCGIYINELEFTLAVLRNKTNG
jgi:hypothetical protein